MIMSEKQPPQQEDPSLESSESAAVKKRKRTTGERWFDYLTYGVVGFGVNLGLSVIITDYFTHGKGKEILQYLSKKSAASLHQLSGCDATKIENNTYGFLKTNLLMSGGHIVMIPIKLMEDSKRHIVHRINRLLDIDKPIIKNGVATSISSLSEDELPPLCEEQPKQSWAWTAMRRLIGISATMTVGTLMGKERLQKVEEVVTDNIMLPAIRNVPVSSIQHLAENDRFQRYARLVSLDQFFTVVTSVLAYLTNGAKKHNDKEDSIPQVQEEKLVRLRQEIAWNKNTHRKDSFHFPDTPSSVVSENVIASPSLPLDLRMRA